MYNTSDLRSLTCTLVVGSSQYSVTDFRVASAAGSASDATSATASIVADALTDGVEPRAIQSVLEAAHAWYPS